MRFFRGLNGAVVCEQHAHALVVSRGPLGNFTPAMLDSHAITKHESLLFAECSVCGAKASQFLREPKRPESEGVRWRKKMKKLESSGKAYPVAGDLFDEDDGGT